MLVLGFTAVYSQPCNQAVTITGATNWNPTRNQRIANRLQLEITVQALLATIDEGTSVKF
jgi:hypothetical protein